MAVCLGCGSRHARVLHSRSAVVVEDEGSCLVVSRVCRRITVCAPRPHGCGEQRAQLICDEGTTRRRHVPGEEGYRG